MTETAARPRSRWIALATLTFAVLLIAVDATVLGLAIPFLTRDLAPTSDQLLWIGDIYSFVLAGLLVTMGSLGDRIGRKRLLLIGATVFGVVSILAAYAPSPELLIAARALLGVAGATLMPSTLSIIRNLFTDAKERTFAIGLWGAMSSAGIAVGPILGGFLLEHFWWGSVFLINVPVMLLLIVVGSITLPESRDPNPGPWDLPSVALSLVGVIGVVYAVKKSAVGGNWVAILIAGVVGAAALAAFAHRQLRLPVPVVDVRLFRRRRFSGAVFADLLAILGLSGIAFFISQYLQLVQGFRPMIAGLAELPLAFGAMLGGVFAGMLARRWGAGPAMAAGLAAAGLAMAAMVFAHADSAYVLVGAVMLVSAFGTAMAFTLSADIVLSSAPKEKAGAASAVAETAYELGTALGIALLGSVITLVYRSELILPAGAPEGAVDSLGTAAEIATGLPPELGAQLLHSAQVAFVDGMRAAAGGAAAAMFVAAVAAWIMLRDRETVES